MPSEKGQLVSERESPHARADRSVRDQNFSGQGFSGAVTIPITALISQTKAALRDGCLQISRG